MTLDDDYEPPRCPPATPAWIVTFADLMSLLMCFFVLLLSFSEMDLEKYKQIAGSLRAAFGVQREVAAPDIPKGTSVIAREFSPNQSEPTPLNQVRQVTSEQEREFLQLGESSARELAAQFELQRLQAQFEALRSTLAEQIEQGSVDVEREAQRILIRIREKDSFPSGTANLRPTFTPTLAEIGRLLQETDGRIRVAGHTDNIPIRTARFRSNWELSAARAVSVVEVLTGEGGIVDQRIAIVGYADTRPVADNATAEGRARNRRVEIEMSLEDEQAAAAEPAPIDVDAVPDTAGG